MQDGGALLPQFVARKHGCKGLMMPDAIYKAETFLCQLVLTWHV